MKKLMILPMCAALALMPGVASAASNVGRLFVRSCGTGANEYYKIGNGQCVECDTGSLYDAGGGVKAYLYNGSFPIQVRTCVTEWSGDYWTGGGKVSKCSGNKCPSGSREVSLYGTTRYVLCVSKGLSTQALGNSVFVNGGSSCYIDKDAAKKQAEEDAKKKAACEASGGSYGGSGGCHCPDSKGLKQTADKKKCECAKSGEVFNSATKMCEAPGKGGNGGNGSGGVVYYPVPVPAPAPKPTKPTKPTEAEKARSVCENATGAVWNETTKLCSCSDTNYEWNGTACVASAAFVQCQTLVSAGMATWNSVTKVCMCLQTGYVFNGTACVETAESIAARKAEQAQAAKAAIASVHSKLKKTQSGFDVSAWKDAEGKFNTARLASDSIAGVVLGTTGALVTSTVVKKNQVENGFEDIRCTIGGQTVAQWGDVFSVGSQM